MKRLLILMAVALLTCSATGCECCGVGNLGLFRGRSRCNSCSPCESRSPCSSNMPIMESSGCGCGCGGGGVDGVPVPVINAPTIAPGPESYTLSHR